MKVRSTVVEYKHSILKRSTILPRLRLLVMRLSKDRATRYHLQTFILAASTLFIGIDAHNTVLPATVVSTVDLVLALDSDERCNLDPLQESLCWFHFGCYSTAIAVVFVVLYSTMEREYEAIPPSIYIVSPIT